MSTSFAEMAERPQHLRPTTKLFLSADIVGSTALKQPFDRTSLSATKSARTWSETIKAFYGDMDKQVTAAWLDTAIEIGEATGETAEQATAKYLGTPLTFWKTIGDEIIFWKDLEKDLQLSFTLMAWLEAVDVISDGLKKKGADHGAPLDLKCTAWIAEFPVRNTAVDANVSSATDRNLPNDYIGPAIDIGFRIGQWSTASRFYVSLDLAYLLAEEHCHGVNRDALAALGRAGSNGKSIRKKLDRLKINFEGTEYLKGVLGGLRYPRFWIPAFQEDTLDHIEDMYSVPAYKTLKYDMVRDYCQAFYEERSKYMMRPFIPHGESATIRNYDDTYRAQYNQLVKVHEEMAEQAGQSAHSASL